ncbi:MAG: hypothetical protein BGO43_12910 [Gammaproteobacteria bacterium 39-13]|nr:ankyrin repeat domain-containing protein [Gammaproteobacteria bacterium]OJV90717.1 MAG: hypothetical protein BGO43_12910 [Gammaproteobacteria bacterium 39-13]
MTELQRQLMKLIFSGQHKEASALLVTHKETKAIDVNFHINVPAKKLSSVTPLIVACIYGAYDLVWDLIDSGAKLDAVDLSQRTAIHAAAAATQGDPAQREQIISLLVHLDRALLTEKDAFGDTPLHKAALQGLPAIAGCLLDYDEKLAYITNEKGETPFKVAEQRETGGEAMRAVFTQRNKNTIPSLTFLCLQNIVKNSELRSKVEVELPETLKQETYLYTPGLIKFLYKMKDPVNTETIEEKMQKLKLL